jgi:hypothetical protein
MLLLEQIGTVCWMKVLEPHTGNALAGVCPIVVQGCATDRAAQTIMQVIRSTVLDIFLKVFGLMRGSFILKTPLPILQRIYSHFYSASYPLTGD